MLNHKRDCLGKGIFTEAKKEKRILGGTFHSFPSNLKMCVWGRSTGKKCNRAPTMLSNKIQPIKGSLNFSLGFQIRL